VRESRPCEDGTCASEGNVVLNMLHEQNHAQEENEWARLSLTPCTELAWSILCVGMWEGGDGLGVHSILSRYIHPLVCTLRAGKAREASKSRQGRQNLGADLPGAAPAQCRDGGRDMSHGPMPTPALCSLSLLACYSPI
jgi:hypothetical protein